MSWEPCQKKVKWGSGEIRINTSLKGWQPDQSTTTNDDATGRRGCYLSKDSLYASVGRKLLSGVDNWASPADPASCIVCKNSEGRNIVGTRELNGDKSSEELGDGVRRRTSPEEKQTRNEGFSA